MAKLDLNVLDKQISSDDFVVVQFKGELDKTNVEDVRSVLSRFTSEMKENHLIFDLTYFNFTNSEGVGTFVSLFYAMQANNKHLYFCTVQPQVMDVFNAVGLTKIIPTHDSVESITSNLIK